MKLKIVEDITDLEQAKNTSLLSGLLSSVCSSVEERAIAAVSSHRVLGASYSASLVQTKSWKVFSVLLIILNVGWFFFAADVSMKNALLTYDGHATHFLLDWIPRVDSVFLGFFLLEFLVKILAIFSSREFMHFELRYLFVDAVVLIVGGVEIVLSLFDISSSIIRNLRLLKIARLTELFHDLKRVRFFAKMTRMIWALAYSGEDLFWGSAFLSMIASFFALLFSQFVMEYVSEATADDEVVDELRPYFSTIPRSILTCLMCVTGGLSWWEVVRHFLEISWFLAWLFLLFIFTMFVAVLNVVTAIFVTDAVGRADADRDVAVSSSGREKRCHQSRTHFRLPGN